MNELDNDNWLKWLGHLKDKQCVTGLEIGTFKGESAVWMCKNIFTDPTSHYYCVDPFTGNVEHAVGNIDCTTLEEQALKNLEPFKNCTVIKGYSQDVLREFAPKLDFIFIDGAHDAMSVLRDSVLAFECLKPGGVIVWDDYLWEVFPEPLDRPRIAIDSFLACYDRQLTITNAQQWQVCAIKK